MVIADYKAISELMTIHHIAGSLEDAAATAFLAGVDVELPDPRAYVALPRLVRAGRVPAARLDEAVARVLAIKFDAGLFDQPLTNTALADARTGTAAHAALARQAALAVPVLLKNDGVLPLARDGHLAVIGHSAADTPIGGYSDVPRHVTSVIDSLRAEAGGALHVEYTEGVRATETRNWYNDDVRLPPAAEMAQLRAAAVELASRATRVLLVLGDNEETAREAWNAQHKGDRASLDLVGEQQALAEAVLALGKPTIVLLAERSSAVNTVPRGTRECADRGLVSGTGDRPRDRRPAVRPRQSRRQAADLAAAFGRAAASLLRPQAERASRLSLRLDRAALCVRSRAELHQLRPVRAARAGDRAGG